MRTQNSLWQDLHQALPGLRSQIYFKSTLTALSHAMQDLVLVGSDQPLVLANFQQERFYRQEARRYQRIARRTDQVYVMATPETKFNMNETPYLTIPLDSEDELAQEWHVIIIGQRYSACLVCREHASPLDATLDSARQFKGIWTFDRAVSLQAARLFLDKVLTYRPDLAAQLQQIQQRYQLTTAPPETSDQVLEVDANLFSSRLVSYLQASQYKQLKAFKAIASQERKERLLNAITTAIRDSVQPESIFATTVQQLGEVFPRCRCLLYPFVDHQPIAYEFAATGMGSLRGQPWQLADHPVLQPQLAQGKAIAIADVRRDLSLQAYPELIANLQKWQVGACLLMPICYQQKTLGILELHQPQAQVWQEMEVQLMAAIATQVGIALMQAQAYDHLTTLNRQLVDLERTQSNLIAIVGHELRTPLSTIQVCLESLASEPDAPLEVQQTMLQMALGDAERLQRLIQDFLTLSRLERGLERWQFEPISVQECVELALSRFNARTLSLPQVVQKLPPGLPWVHTDGEALIEVLTKLLDNAFKFTDANGTITIQAQVMADKPFLEVRITDTGRGLEAGQLETIFERFYQTEGYLRRTVGGSGLGLAICRRMVHKWGGTIQAESAGLMQGCTFRLTLPI